MLPPKYTYALPSEPRLRFEPEVIAAALATTSAVLALTLEVNGSVFEPETRFAGDVKVTLMLSLGSPVMVNLTALVLSGAMATAPTPWATLPKSRSLFLAMLREEITRAETKAFSEALFCAKEKKGAVTKTTAARRKRMRFMVIPQKERELKKEKSIGVCLRVSMRFRVRAV